MIESSSPIAPAKSESAPKTRDSLTHAPYWRNYPLDPSANEHTVVGNLRVLQHVHSPQLENHRPIFAYLPPSYETSEKRYPVIYMHDGQNLFDEVTSFGEEWGIDDTMDELGELNFEAIVIGIPNMGEERCNEYSPYRDAKHGGGKADLYLSFIVDTLKPRIDRDFRTLTDREHTGIVGSSMGGLVSLYAYFSRSETFGIAGVMSPSLWFADRAIFPFVARAPFSQGRIYLDVGTDEGEETVDNVKRLIDILIEKGYRRRDTLFYVEQEGAAHTESAWRKRFRHAVPRLLKGVMLPSNWPYGKE